MMQPVEEFRENLRRAGIRDDKPLAAVMTTLFETALAAKAAVQDGARGLTPEGETELVRRVTRAVQIASEQHRLRLERRASWIAGGVVAASLLVGAIGGYWWGWSGGRATVRVIEDGITKAVMNGDEGERWLGLMERNGIHEALGHCAGTNVFVSNGRRACLVPMWLDDPPGAPQISRK